MDHNRAPAASAAPCRKRKGTSRVTGKTPAAHPSNVPGVPGAPIKCAGGSQRIHQMCQGFPAYPSNVPGIPGTFDGCARDAWHIFPARPGCPAHPVDVSGIPCRLCHLSPFGHARQRFPRAIPFRGEPLAHSGNIPGRSGIPTDVADVGNIFPHHAATFEP